jgi:hypothetical protein
MTHQTIIDVNKCQPSAGFNDKSERNVSIMVLQLHLQMNTIPKE